MPISDTAYCGIEDLRKGDIPLPQYMGDGSSYVNTAAEEIDAAIGSVYVTPVIFPTDLSGNVAASVRPSYLLLKKINWLLASGRLVLDLAAASENSEQHAYGLGMLKEGLTLLKAIVEGTTRLLEVPRIGDDLPADQRNPTGPMIFNEDPVSLVESFYRRHDGSAIAQVYPAGPVVPYGQRIL